MNELNKVQTYQFQNTQQPIQVKPQGWILDLDLTEAINEECLIARLNNIQALKDFIILHFK